MIGMKSIEQAVATALHEVAIGAKYVQKAIDKAEAIVQADAPAVEALTSLVDPRAAAIERIGVAVLGELEPQISKVAGDVSTAAAAPTLTISLELYAELKTLYASFASELTAAKAAVKAA